MCLVIQDGSEHHPISNKDLVRFHRLGVAVGEMYVAAQGISYAASDAACNAIEKTKGTTGQLLTMRLGFNSVVRKHKLKVRA